MDLLQFSGKVLLLLIIIYAAVLTIYSLLKGAPYAPLGSSRLKSMKQLLKLKSGEKVADLGSGDGRVVIALAGSGAQAHGYEINPFLVLISILKINKAGLKGRAYIHWKSYWHEDFSTFNAVTVYGITHIMAGMEKKLQNELKPGARIVSNHFQFPNWKKIKSKNDVHLYIRD